MGKLTETAEFLEKHAKGIRGFSIVLGAGLAGLFEPTLSGYLAYIGGSVLLSYPFEALWLRLMPQETRAALLLREEMNPEDREALMQAVLDRFIAQQPLPGSVRDSDDDKT